MFFGFLDNNINKRRSQLDNLASFEYTMIFYEAPHRIKETLMLMLDVFGDRQISLSREISKKFESVYRGSLKELLELRKEHDCIIFFDEIFTEITKNDKLSKDVLDFLCQMRQSR